MGLEKEKEESQEKVNQGGKPLNEGEIKSIAVAVKGLLDADKEKKGVTEQLSGVTKQVGELKGEMGKITQSLHCTADGRYCFETPGELIDFMRDQATKVKEMDGKISEIATQVKTLKPAPTPAGPEGLKHLPKMTAEMRKAKNEEENRARDLDVKAIHDYFGVTDNDQWRQIEKGLENIEAITRKANIRQKVFNSATDEERKKVIVFACKDGVCKPLREGMEKEDGVKFYVKDKKGRFQPADKPEEKSILF